MASFKDPPKWALRLLHRICPTDLIEEVEGDLYEAYQWRIEEMGVGHAQRRYIFEVFRYFRYYRIKVQTQNNGLMLLNNYLKTGLRFLWKTRGYSALNVMGLGLGIAVCWLAYIFVTDEYSFDGFHEKGDRVYRPTARIEVEDRESVFAGSSYLMGEEFPKVVPGIEASSRFKSGFGLLKLDADYFSQSFHYADPDFFSMFTMDFAKGQAGDFSQPNVAVISEQVATRIGLEGDLADQTITLRVGGQDVAFAINGVYHDFPTNSSIRPQILIPFSFWAGNNERRLKNWFDINMNSFFLLSENTSAEQVADKMTEHLLANEDFHEATVRLGLQQLTDIHLNPEFETGNGINARGDNQMILIVSIVGLLCLVIACMNYSTFAVGNYLVRLREVAVRKVFGAQRSSVFRQFVAEAFISAFLGLLVAIGFMALLLPGFSEYANKSYEISLIFNQEILIGGLILLVGVTLMAGIYPALLLSGFSILNGLKGKSKVSGKSRLGKVLVTLQFGISIFLIAGMLSVNKQINYLLNMDLGYSAEDMVMVVRPINDMDQMRRYKQDMLQIPGIEQVSLASGYNGTGLELEDGSTMRVRHARIDSDYLDIMDIQLLNGRNFDPELPTDLSSSIIVNKAFVDELGLEDPIGYQTKFDYGEMEGATIIGVVDNYYYNSPRGIVEPMILYMSPQLVIYEHLLKINPRTEGILDDMEAVYRKHFAPIPFNHSFMEDQLAAEFELETNIRKISQAGAGVAILLTCLGLMGFVGTQIRQRMKEVSIRKVIGAEPRQIFRLFSSRYIGMIIIGFAIGLAAAVWLVHMWLEGFANSIGFTWDTGAIALSVIVIVAAITIFSQLYRAMYLNPSVFLKEE